MKEQVTGGELVVGLDGCVVHPGDRHLIVEIPVQYRTADHIEVGSVYIGADSIATVVREARRWAEDCARSARSQAK